MKYFLSERAAQALKRLLKDASAVVPADVAPTRLARPDVAPGGGGKDRGVFQLKKVDGVDTITNGWIMFSRCGGPLAVPDKAVDSAGVYSVQIQNSRPSTSVTWNVSDTVPVSTVTYTYVPIMEFAEEESGKLTLSTDYRRMPIIPAYDRDNY